MEPFDGNELLDDLAGEINRGILKAKPEIENKVKDAIGEALRISREYLSLQGGDLRKHMGLANPGQLLEAVEEGLKDGVIVEPIQVRRTGNEIEGGLTVSILRKDLTEVLELPAAEYESRNVKGVTTKIPWLEWLLRSDEVLISTHFYLGNPRNTAKSRAGAFMIPAGKSGRTWVVPPEYAGTNDDNWLTKALVEIEAKVVDIMEQEFSKTLG